MNVQKFLNKKSFAELEDIELQAEYFAYTVARHYNISLHDVYKMPLPIFKQSLKWAMAITEEKEKEEKKQEQQSKAGDREVGYVLRSCWWCSNISITFWCYC